MAALGGEMPNVRSFPSFSNVMVRVLIILVVVRVLIVATRILARKKCGLPFRVSVGHRLSRGMLVRVRWAR